MLNSDRGSASDGLEFLNTNSDRFNAETSKDIIDQIATVRTDLSKASEFQKFMASVQGSTGEQKRILEALDEQRTWEL